MGAMKNTPLALTIGEINALRKDYYNILAIAKTNKDFYVVDSCQTVLRTLDEVDKIIERNFKNS